MMTPEQWQQVKTAFEEISEAKSSEEISELFDRKNLNDEQRKQVEKMLAAYDPEFLEKSALENEADCLASDYTRLIGHSIDHFSIESLSGVGGMGAVYKARDTKLGREVALKVLPSSILDSEQLRQFETEAFAASSLNHPNIVTVHEIGQKDPINYIVTEFISGKTLRERISKEQLNTLEVIRISIDIAEALAAAHSSGIVHRDIKPENIMFHGNGYTKVVDFGLARFTQSVSRETQHSLPGVDNAESQPIGTFQYMAPEQLLGEEPDERADIWALGVVIYEMLFKRVPFHWRPDAALKTQIQNSQLVFSESPDLNGFHRILEKALSKDKCDRYENVEEMLVELKSLRSKHDREIPEGLIKLFVGDNHQYYLDAWHGGTRPNYACLLFGPIWMGYRKMYTWGISAVTVFLVVGRVAEYFSLGEVIDKARWAVFPTLTLVANAIYEDHVKSKISGVRAQGLNETLEAVEVKSKGGTSFLGAGFIVLWFCAVAFFMPTTVHLPAVMDLISSMVTPEPSKESSQRPDDGTLKLQRLYAEIVLLHQKFLTIERQPGFDLQYIEQAHDPAELRAFAAKQAALFKEYSLLNNEVADKIEQLVKLRGQLGKRSLPSFSADVRFLRLRAQAWSRFQQFAEDTPNLTPLTAGNVRAARLRLLNDIEPLAVELEQSLGNLAELTRDMLSE